MRASFAYGKPDTIAIASTATATTATTPGRCSPIRTDSAHHGGRHRRRHAAEEPAVLRRDVEPGQPDRGTGGDHAAGDRDQRRRRVTVQRRVDHHRRGDAERAHVGQRVHLGAERARHAQLAGQRAVQAVEDHAADQQQRGQPRVAVHAEEDRAHAEHEARDGAGVGHAELDPAGQRLLAGQQRDGLRDRRVQVVRRAGRVAGAAAVREGMAAAPAGAGLTGMTMSIVSTSGRPLRMRSKATVMTRRRRRAVIDLVEGVGGRTPSAQLGLSAPCGPGCRFRGADVQSIAARRDRGYLWYAGATGLSARVPPYGASTSASSPSGQRSRRIRHWL